MNLWFAEAEGGTYTVGEADKELATGLDYLTAARIVFSVNAFQGSSVEAVKGLATMSPIVQELLSRKIASLKEERDQLRSALRKVMGNVDYLHGCCSFQSPVGAALPAEVIEQARKALGAKT